MVCFLLLRARPSKREFDMLSPQPAEYGRTQRDLTHAKAFYWRAVRAAWWSSTSVRACDPRATTTTTTTLFHISLRALADARRLLHFSLKPLLSSRPEGWGSLSSVGMNASPKGILMQKSSESCFFCIVRCTSPFWISILITEHFVNIGLYFS